MRVIFLDIDGVLNSERNLVAYGGYPFPGVDDPEDNHFEGNLDRLAIALVYKLSLKHQADIVLHSAWRRHVNAVEFGKKYGLNIVVGTNPDAEKAESILQYLDAHKNIEEYVILDDDRMVGCDEFKQVFVDPVVGLSAIDYRLAYNILKGLKFE